MSGCGTVENPLLAAERARGRGDVPMPDAGKSAREQARVPAPRRYIYVYYGDT